MKHRKEQLEKLIANAKTFEAVGTITPKSGGFDEYDLHPPDGENVWYRDIWDADTSELCPDPPAEIPDYRWCGDTRPELTRWMTDTEGNPVPLFTMQRSWCESCEDSHPLHEIKQELEDLDDESDGFSIEGLEARLLNLLIPFRGYRTPSTETACLNDEEWGRWYPVVDASGCLTGSIWCSDEIEQAYANIADREVIHISDLPFVEQERITMARTIGTWDGYTSRSALYRIVVNYDGIPLQEIGIVPDRPFTWPANGIIGTDGTCYDEVFADSAHLLTPAEVEILANTGRPFDYGV